MKTLERQHIETIEKTLKQLEKLGSEDKEIRNGLYQLTGYLMAEEERKHGNT